MNGIVIYLFFYFTSMLEDIKKMQGINHNDFDDIIKKYIDSAKMDLQMCGIEKSKISIR